MVWKNALSGYPDPKKNNGGVTMEKAMKITFFVLCGILLAGLIGLSVAGWQIGWGPFRPLFKGYESEVRAIEERYDVQTRTGEIVFYGASNFRLWTAMEEDLAPYPVQNHGFGGATDRLMSQYADRILFPYEPKLVFFQTASNDYVNLSGTDEEKAALCMAYKREMFDAFHEALPGAKFVVTSGLLLPGRSQYMDLTIRINQELDALCAERDYMFFVDASDLTWDGNAYKTELFIKDGIHLNHDGQLLWCENYIRPMIEMLWENGS